MPVILGDEGNEGQSGGLFSGSEQSANSSSQREVNGMVVFAQAAQIPAAPPFHSFCAAS
ncbi:hypothetical protein EV129_10932 [Rhizobium azibense]|uniref:Uncharacterized protein n=1 Tax=Rhizobium azibense TaxID=1136135 RepID=A0A4R3RNS2_9HYPH|nr:hypothetical protein EV129_10932 [Rhizobium azibense]